LVETDVPRDDCLSMWESIALPEGYASEGPTVEAHRDLVGDDAAEITLSGKGISARSYLDAQDGRMDYARRWAEVFNDIDVLLMPNMPTTAFPVGALRPDTIAGQPVPDGYDIWCASMPPANLAGLPAASVPIATGADGLPVAAQVMGARWTDATVLRVAALLDAGVNR
jgi:Asp-tRNA(Asn)/Glu-tRNA(Gln) amidotransferase A subunit family amidase